MSEPLDGMDAMVPDLGSCADLNLGSVGLRRAGQAGLFEGGHQNTHLYQYLISLCCEYILIGYFYPGLNLYNNLSFF